MASDEFTSSSEFQANATCQICAKREATEVCCCRFPFPLLCESCKENHSQKKEVSLHFSLPIQYLSSMKTREEADNCRQLLFQFDKAASQLAANSEQTSACQERIRCLCDARKEELESYAQAQIHRLEAFKTLLKDPVAQAVETARKELMQESAPDNPLAALLWQASRSNSYAQLRLFECQEGPSTPDISELIPVQWQGKVAGTGIRADFPLTNSENTAKTLPSEVTTATVTRVDPVATSAVLPDVLTWLTMMLLLSIWGNASPSSCSSPGFFGKLIGRKEQVSSPSLYDSVTHMIGICALVLFSMLSFSGPRLSAAIICLEKLLLCLIAVGASIAAALSEANRAKHILIAALLLVLAAFTLFRHFQSK